MFENLESNRDTILHVDKKVVLVIYYSGIPCFAYMMAELSNFINYQLVNVQKLVERITKTQENSLLPAFIDFIYINRDCLNKSVGSVHIRVNFRIKKDFWSHII